MKRDNILFFNNIIFSSYLHEQKIAYSPLESQQFCEIDKGEIIYNQLFVEAIHYFELLQIAHLQLPVTTFLQSSIIADMANVLEIE